jgi:branched-chain amino acid transport system permease protein
VATPRSRLFAVAGACLLAVLLALPAFGSRNLINELIFVFTMLALAQYWNLLAGYAGLVSVGQQAFVGLGGYLLFALTIHQGLDPLVAILTAGAITAVLAVPTALVVFRLRGAYFAIGTWVVAEVFRLVLAQFKGLGGGTGTSLPPSVTNEVAGIAWVKALFGVSTSAARDIITYWAALALAAGTVLLVYLILRSRYGLALAAIRDSERAAESVGVDNFKTKLKVYIAAAAGTGLVGALIYLQKARISPDAAFSVADWTANVIFIVVIGGIGTIEGPIVGVLVFYVLQTNLAHWGTWYLILIGAFAIAIMLLAPRPGSVPGTAPPDRQRARRQARSADTIAARRARILGRRGDIRLGLGRLPAVGASWVKRLADPTHSTRHCQAGLGSSLSLDPTSLRPAAYGLYLFGKRTPSSRPCG